MFTFVDEQLFQVINFWAFPSVALFAYIFACCAQRMPATIAKAGFSAKTAALLVRLNK